MTDFSTGSTDNYENYVKKVKREFEGWREVILQLDSILRWEQNWYPGMLFGVTSTLFLLLWLWDPSLLTSISTGCLLVTLLGYLVPAVTASLCHQSSWTAAKERQYEEFCKTVVAIMTLLSEAWRYVQNWKVTSPKTYYITAVVFLGFLAWIGNEVNNLLLTYLTVMTVIMLPGLKHHGILQRYYNAALVSSDALLKNILGNKKTKDN